MDFSVIESLVRTLRESETLTEVEVRITGASLRIRRPSPGESFSGEAIPAPVGKPAPDSTAPTPARSASLRKPITETAAAVVTISSPLVGIFRARRPHAVRVGDVVSVNELLGQIEAMRLLNDCVATTAGRVQAVLIEDGRPVEYGQPLLEIAPEAIP